MQRDIDTIVAKVEEVVPPARVYQLEKKLPTDDDGIWYFYLADVERDIQIESSNGMCPFLVELMKKARTMQGMQIPLTKL